MGAQDSEDAFCQVFDRYAPAILRYAQRRLASREAAQDVVGDTFTAAWRHWDRRPAPGVLLPWLYAIAGNAVRDQWRSARRQRRLTGRLSALRPAGQAADPGEGVVLGRSISQALAALPEADREVLRLVAWEGQTDARMLGLALGAAARIGPKPRSARAAAAARAPRRRRQPGCGPAAHIPAASPHGHGTEA